MRTVAAFFATLLIAVPAGWHALGADIQTDGPATRPKLKTLQVDGVKVSVELDRGVLMAGGTLKATLIATSEKSKTISLDVRALEDMGYGEERVANPPQQVGKRRITIESAPEGGKPVEVAFKLGSRGRKGAVSWYDIEVTKTGTKRTDDMFYAAEEDQLPIAASVGAATWTGNSIPLAIELPAVIPTDKPFTVAVRITNTTKKPIDWLEIDVGDQQLNYGGLEGELYAGHTGEQYEIGAMEGNYDNEPLEPGQQRVARFVITPTDGTAAVKEYTIVAHAHGSGIGAMDVMTFKPTPVETAPTPVATK